MLKLWGYEAQKRLEGANVIAICEAAMVPAGFSAFQTRMQDRDVVYFIDNSVSLFAMVKGTSNQPDVARCTHLVGLQCLAYDTRVWLEFVDSESNWADGLSRDLGMCSFCMNHRIKVNRIQLPQIWWTLDLKDLKSSLLKA